MKKTQKLKHNHESSESSDDESLLAIARKKRRNCKVADKYRINVDNPLCDVRQEACEFCDRTFSNRLQSLVHNSKHIIIPLIKCDASQPLHKQRSTSPVKELPKFNNNKIILGKKKMNNTSLRDRIVFDDDDPDVIVLSDTDSIEENKIKGISKEVAKLKPDNNENILNSFVSDCRVILDDTISLISTIEPDEDIIVNQHHNNDTSQLGNNLSNHHIQGKTTVVSQERGLMDNKSIDNIEDKVYSVHNDELLRTATHYCEFCHREFPNSFAYTTHKARHLYVKIEPIFVDLPNSSLVSTLLPIATKKKTTCSEKPVKKNSFDENYFFKIPAHPDHTNKICNATNHKQNRTCKKMSKRGNFKKKRITPCLKCDIKIFRSLSGDNVGTIHSGISNGTQKPPVAIPELANTLQRLSLDNGFMLQDSEEPECVLGF
ncbi:hypothetical protein JYU34_018165 [Plutella xylostella]|uniref:C2H2-type domain-containing protein n=1 Tax=Plutella xylostella TaxID=51655 RepID=A0ABQ7PZV8_PLUXY|nr:hypothetical protein JYU34_018165 [Plutella xylostella]